MEARFTTSESISAKSCPFYIKCKFLQAKRRQETLEIQKLKRDQQIEKRRNIDEVENYCMEIDEKVHITTVPNNEAYQLAISMMYSEWMLEVPKDIDNWIAVLCPEGKRCCVIAQDNKTKVFNKYGTLINNFPSLFPFGCHLPINSGSSHRKRTVLDCVYNFKLKKYFILDIIEWMGVPYTEFDAEFRFYFILSKLNEMPGISEQSAKNYYPFELAPRMLTRDLYQYLLEKCEFFKDNVTLDGINFYYPESLYTPGESPLVLWLKPFMVPDVLQKPVNDQLAALHRPHNFTNVYEYSQNLLKKNKNKKKKKKNVICDKMEIDNLVEMEAYKDHVIENEMCVEK